MTGYSDDGESVEVGPAIRTTRWGAEHTWTRRVNALQAQSLAKARQVQASRAALRTHLKHMPPQEARQLVADLIYDTPDWLSTQLTIRLLQQIPYVATARAEKYMVRAGVGFGLQLRALTVRQRQQLAQELLP